MDRFLGWIGSFFTAGHIRNENDGRSRRNEDLAEKALAKAESAILLNNQLVQLMSTGKNKLLLEQNQQLIQDMESIKEKNLLLQQKVIELESNGK